MDIQQLKQDILTNNIKPTYLFYGDELSLQDIYIKKISEVTGKQVVRIDYLENVYNKLCTRTLIKTTGKIYVVRNDDKYLKQEKHWDKVIKGTAQKDNHIIFLYSNIDNRSSLIKRHEEIAVKFDFIGSNLLINRVEAITKLPRQYCADLVQMCGNNYGRIEKEIYKLNMLHNIDKCSLTTCYLKFKECNLIHEEVGDIIFKLTEAIIRRDKVNSFKLYEKIKRTEDGPLRILAVLYNSFRNILLVQSTAPNDRTEAVLGIPSNYIYVASQKIGHYTTLELVNILRLLQECESGVKNSIIDMKVVMDYFLLRIL